MKKRKGFNKYFIQKKTAIISVFAILSLLCFYIFITIFETNGYFGPNEKIINIVKITRDILLILLSIFGGAMISSFLIETNERNGRYVKEVCDDLFIGRLDSDDINKLKEIIYEDCSEKEIEIESFLFDRIKESDYYFTECNVVVNCKIQNGKIIKNIVKTMKIRSLKKNFEVSDFKLVGITGQEKFSKVKLNDKFEIEHFILNGKKVKKQDLNFSLKEVESNEYGYLHNKYKFRCICTYPGKISLSNTNDTSIEIKYKTVTPLCDLSYTSRITAPCQNYSLTFILDKDSSSEYDVVGSAFGFMETGSKTPNIEQNIFKTKFDCWTFKENGVVVCLIPKNKIS